MGFKHESSFVDQRETISAMGKGFRPEFLNRIDKIILFKHLAQNNIKEITRQELDHVSAQILEMHDLSILFSDVLIEHIAESGYSETNGAREIKRTIEKLITEPFSEQLLLLQTKGNEFKNQNVKVDYNGGEVTFDIGGKKNNDKEITVPPDIDDE